MPEWYPVSVWQTVKTITQAHKVSTPFCQVTESQRGTYLCKLARVLRKSFNCTSQIMLCMAEVIGVLQRSEDLSPAALCGRLQSFCPSRTRHRWQCMCYRATLFAMYMLLAAISVPVKAKSAASTMVVESSSAQYKLFSMQQWLHTILDAISAE